MWTFARDEKLPIEITEQALAAHLKILDCSYLLVRISFVCRQAKEKRKLLSFLGQRENQIVVDRTNC